MKFLKNTIGFLSVFCIVPAVFGVTMRPPVVGAITAGPSLPPIVGAGNSVMAVSANGAARRMPTAAVQFAGFPDSSQRIPTMFQSLWLNSRWLSESAPWFWHWQG